MSAKAKLDLSNDERWDLWKAQGMEMSKLELHSATPVFVTTTKTVASFKPGLKNLKIWKTPMGYLLEMGNKKQGIETAAVSTFFPT